MAVVAQQAEAVAQRRRQPLVVVLVAVVGGIALDRATGLAAACSWGAVAVGWPIWLLCYRGRRDRLAAAALLLAVAGLAAAWHHTRWRWFADDEIGRFAREQAAPVCLRGRVRAVPAMLRKPTLDPLQGFAAGDQSRVWLDIEAIRDRDRWRSASGYTSVLIAGLATRCRPGDELQVFGKLSAESPQANPGMHDFAAAARGDGRLCSVWAGHAECLSVVAPAPGGLARLVHWQDFIAELRGSGDRLLRQYVGRGRAALAMTMLLGDRSELTRDESQSFTETGTVHLLVIAGLHVGILAAGLFFVLRMGWLSRRWGPLLIAALAVFYAMLTDMHPPVLRATIMIVVGCLAISTGRRALTFNTLALAAVVVLAINPADLFRVGAHLSFLAVAALVWLEPRMWMTDPLNRAVAAAPGMFPFRGFGRLLATDPIDRLLASSRPAWQRALHAIWRRFREMLFAGLAIGIVSLPLAMHEFHIFSVTCAVLTPLLLLPLATALLSGMGVLLFGWLLPPVAACCGSVCDGSLWVILATVQGTRHLPGSHAWVAGPPAWWLAGFYAALVAAVAWPQFCPRRRWCAGLLCGWVAVGLLLPIWLRNDGKLRCTVLSVGHGNAVVVELPDGRTMIADAGRLGMPGEAVEAISCYLWSRGRTHVDAIVLSHADSDHYNAVPGLLDRFSVGVVYVSRLMRERQGRGVANLFAAIRRAGIPVRTVHSGDRLDSGAVRIDVIHPPEKGVLAPEAVLDNANCVVLAVEFRGRRLLLPGDLESPGLDDVIAEPPWPCDLLVAPHHGSSHNDPPGFAAWCSPATTVVSASYREDLRAARAAYQARGRRMLLTAADGAVTAVFSEGPVTIDAWRPHITEASSEPVTQPDFYDDEDPDDGA